MNRPLDKSAQSEGVVREEAPKLSYRSTANKEKWSVVEYCVHALSDHPPEGDFTPAQLVVALKHGLPIHELEKLRRRLNLPMERLAPMLGISKATLQRRKTSGKLDIAESDRVVRFARLFGKAVEALDGEENARLWLSSAQRGLGGEIPLEFAETEVGAREVEDLLGRIDLGVYS